MRVTELADKYIVVKREDVHNYLKGNSRYHTEDGKKDNRYVVLNLEDDISLAHLSGKLTEIIHKRMLAHLDEERGTLHEVKMSPVKVKDIAIDLVNAILKAEDIAAIEDAQNDPLWRIAVKKGNISKEEGGAYIG